MSLPALEGNDLRTAIADRSERLREQENDLRRDRDSAESERRLAQHHLSKAEALDHCANGHQAEAIRIKAELDALWKDHA